MKPNKNDASSFMIGGQPSGSLSYGKKQYGSKQTVQKPFSPGADLVIDEHDQNSMEPVDFAEFDNQNSKRGTTS